MGPPTHEMTTMNRVQTYNLQEDPLPDSAAHKVSEIGQEKKNRLTREEPHL